MPRLMKRTLIGLLVLLSTPALASRELTMEHSSPVVFDALEELAKKLHPEAFPQVRGHDEN